MKSEDKIKYAVALTVAVIAVGAFLIAPSALAGKGSVDPDEDEPARWHSKQKWRKYPMNWWIEPDEELDEDDPVRWHRFPNPIWLRCPLKRWIYVLRDGVPDTVKGEAVALHRNILVLRIDESDVNVIVPKMWIAEDEIMEIEELFEEEVAFEFGDGLKVYTLKLERSESTHTVTTHFAYKMSGDSVTANALLPFNINVTTEPS